MADEKSQAEKKLADEKEMKKRYRLLLQLKKVEMVRDLNLLDAPKDQDKK